MIGDLLFAVGMVAVFEGLVLALAPGHLRRAIEVIEALGAERARMLGLAVVGFGVVLVWIARA